MSSNMYAAADGPDATQIAYHCTRLLHLYAYAQDTRQAEVFVKLFTEDAIWKRPGIADPVRGISAIRENISGLINGRPEKSVYQHIITNVRVEPTSWVTATSECYALVYSGVKVENEVPPFIGMPVGILKYRNRFRLVEAGWHIEFHEAEGVFQRNAA